MEARALGFGELDLPKPSSGAFILGMRVDATSAASAIEKILVRAANGSGGYVCVANVHMIMEAFDSPSFRAGVNRALAVVPDGMPLVWCLRRLGHIGQGRVAGPDLLPSLCEAAGRRGLSVGFYGGSALALRNCTANLAAAHLGLNVGVALAPPFEPLTPEETTVVVDQINESGVKILFVALGCPKQERWMMENAESIRPVMVGIGAAIDYHGGLLKRAPVWMQQLGMEWLFRLAAEPRRLARRYAVQNPRFAWHVLVGLARERSHKIFAPLKPAASSKSISKNYGAS